MSTGKNINFDIRISGSVSLELPEAALEKIADDLGRFVARYERDHGVDILNAFEDDGAADEALVEAAFKRAGATTNTDADAKAEDPLGWMNDPDYGACLRSERPRKTAAHADAARHQVIRHRILREAGPTAGDPFGLGCDASRRLSEIIADVVGTPKTRKIH